MPRPVWRCAADGQPSSAQLRAGSISACLSGAALKDIRTDDTEVLRSITVVVATPAGDIEPSELRCLHWHAMPGSFDVTLHAVYRKGSLLFAVQLCILGDEADQIAVAMRGVAVTRFDRTRIGLMLQHPPRYGRQTCQVVDPFERTTDARFPTPTSTSPPGASIVALRFPIAPGAAADLQMEGEAFEMDPSSSDGCIMTRCTPSAMPQPLEVQPGTIVEQRVTLRIDRQ